MIGGGYAFITALLKGEEARTVNNGHIAGLSRLTRVSEVINAIRDTDIGEYLEGLQLRNFEEADRAIWLYLGNCFRRLEWLSDLPSDIPPLVSAYLVKYDVLNIKAALQAITFGQPPRLIPVGSLYENGLLEELASASEEEAIATVLINNGFDEYVPIVRNYEPEGGIRSRFQTWAQLENEYYRHLLEVAGKGGSRTQLTGLLATAIDMRNLQVLLRGILGGVPSEVTDHAIDGGRVITGHVLNELTALRINELSARLDGTVQQTIIDEISSHYERNSDISIIDQVIDRHHFRLSQEALSQAMMSPLVVMWYIIVKENEVRNVRMVLKAVLDGIPVEEIRENLVLAS